MKTVMNHSQDGGLLKMIRRTDPVILRCNNKHFLLYLQDFPNFFAKNIGD